MLSGYPKTPSPGCQPLNDCIAQLQKSAVGRVETVRSDRLSPARSRLCLTLLLIVIHQMLQVDEAGSFSELWQSPNNAIGTPSAIRDFMQTHRAGDLTLVFQR